MSWWRKDKANPLFPEPTVTDQLPTPIVDNTLFTPDFSPKPIPCDIYGHPDLVESPLPAYTLGKFLPLEKDGHGYWLDIDPPEYPGERARSWVPEECVGKWRYRLIPKYAHACCPECGMDRFEVEELKKQVDDLLHQKHVEFYVKVEDLTKELNDRLTAVEASVAASASSDTRRMNWLETQGFRVDHERTGAYEVGEIEIRDQDHPWQLIETEEGVGLRWKRLSWREAIDLKIGTETLDERPMQGFLYEMMSIILNRLDAIENGTAPGVLTQIASLADQLRTQAQILIGHQAHLHAIARDLMQQGAVIEHHALRLKAIPEGVGLQVAAHAINLRRISEDIEQIIKATNCHRKEYPAVAAVPAKPAIPAHVVIEKAPKARD